MTKGNAMFSNLLFMYPDSRRIYGFPCWVMHHFILPTEIHWDKITSSFYNHSIALKWNEQSFKTCDWRCYPGLDRSIEHSNWSKTYRSQQRKPKKSLISAITMLWCLNISKNARSCALFLCCHYKGLMSVSSLGSQTEPHWPEVLSPAPKAACGVVCFHLNNEWHGWWAHTKTQQRPACRPTRLTESAAQTLINLLYTALV